MRESENSIVKIQILMMSLVLAIFMILFHPIQRVHAFNPDNVKAQITKVSVGVPITGTDGKQYTPVTVYFNSSDNPEEGGGCFEGIVKALHDGTQHDVSGVGMTLQKVSSENLSNNQFYWKDGQGKVMFNVPVTGANGEQTVIPASQTGTGHEEVSAVKPDNTVSIQLVTEIPQLDPIESNTIKYVYKPGELPKEYTGEEELIEIAPPTGEILIYNDKEQVGVEAGTGYTLEGTTKGILVDDYEAIAKLQNGYKWNDGTTADKTISWKIVPAKIVSIKLKQDSFEYTGSNITPIITEMVTDPAGVTGKGFDVSISYPEAIEPGTYTITATGRGNLTGSASAAFTINAKPKEANIMTVKTKNVSIKFTSLEKKEKTIKPGKIYVIKDAQGELKYEKVKIKASNGKKLRGKRAKAIKVDPKSGKITIKKGGLTRGRYKVYIKISDTGSDRYLPIVTTVIVNVKVK